MSHMYIVWAMWATNQSMVHSCVACILYIGLCMCYIVVIEISLHENSKMVILIGHTISSFPYIHDEKSLAQRQLSIDQMENLLVKWIGLVVYCADGEVQIWRVFYICSHFQCILELFPISMKSEKTLTHSSVFWRVVTKLIQYITNVCLHHVYIFIHFVLKGPNIIGSHVLSSELSFRGQFQWM